jgi:putative endonuclease
VAAETLAEWWLRLKFYRILARRWRGKGGEIDIVAARGPVLAFVEVKARRSLEEAAAALAEGAETRRRVAAAAKDYLQRHPRQSVRRVRFDAVLVAPRRLPRHIESAFGEGGR